LLLVGTVGLQFGDLALQSLDRGTLFGVLLFHHVVYQLKALYLV